MIGKRFIGLNYFFCYSTLPLAEQEVEGTSWGITKWLFSSSDGARTCWALCECWNHLFLCLLHNPWIQPHPMISCEWFTKFSFSSNGVCMDENLQKKNPAGCDHHKTAILFCVLVELLQSWHLAQPSLCFVVGGSPIKHLTCRSNLFIGKENSVF